jgi:hypothetical protein
MSARVRQKITFDAATCELWCAAESGDAGELTAMLDRGVDVDACNEHGMTALMRAARGGHAAAVRALLKGGADPNLARNDRFTALALAAFFGHTETVRILIDHGAKTEIVTRSGTSPRMWATARTFTEAARCLEKPVSRPVPVAVPSPVRRAPARVTAVKTLKDPPEIWDLVHEVPNTPFNARSAFVSRIRSMNRAVAVGAFAVLLFAISCGVAAFVFRSSEASNIAEVPPVQTPAEVRVDPPVPVESSVTEPVVTEDNALSSHVVRKTPVMRPFKVRPVVDGNVVQEAPSREEPQVAVPEIETPKPRELPVKSAPNAALSPHLITPSKSAAPKGKVIQWP